MTTAERSTERVTNTPNYSTTALKRLNSIAWYKTFE